MKTFILSVLVLLSALISPAQKIDLQRGVEEVGVYRYNKTSGKSLLVGFGAIYSTSLTNRQALVPISVFLSGNELGEDDDKYLLCRTNNPASECFGFISSAESYSTNQRSTIALVEVGSTGITRRALQEKFGDVIPRISKCWSTPILSDTFIAKNRITTNILSLVESSQTRIVGYVALIEPADKIITSSKSPQILKWPTMVMIVTEEKIRNKMPGTTFFDEWGRLYLLTGKHRNSQSVILSEPLELEKVQ